LNAPSRAPRNEDQQLTSIEQAVSDICRQTADRGEVMPTNDEINARIGSQASAGSTAATILGRIAAKGWIIHQVYQRGRQVTIVATGRQTAAPACTAPHWRNRTDRPSSPAIHQVRQTVPELAKLIETEARKRGMALPDFLCDLVYIGWHDYADEQQRPR
jgi:hypothetical protein